MRQVPGITTSSDDIVVDDIKYRQPFLGLFGEERWIIVWRSVSNPDTRGETVLRAEARVTSRVADQLEALHLRRALARRSPPGRAPLRRGRLRRTGSGAAPRRGTCQKRPGPAPPGLTTGIFGFRSGRRARHEPIHTRTRWTQTRLAILAGFDPPQFHEASG